MVLGSCAQSHQLAPSDFELLKFGVPFGTPNFRSSFWEHAHGKSFVTFSADFQQPNDSAKTTEPLPHNN
jgi:hypothetical protein